MALFKKRTTKTVGKDIGKRLKSIEVKKKVLRTLKKEDEVREEERKLNQKIRAIKERKPSFSKTALRAARTTIKVGKKVHRSVKASAKKRRATIRRTPKPKPISLNDIFGVR